MQRLAPPPRPAGFDRLLAASFRLSRRDLPALLRGTALSYAPFALPAAPLGDDGSLAGLAVALLPLAGLIALLVAVAYAVTAIGLAVVVWLQAEVAAGIAAQAERRSELSPRPLALTTRQR